jgi:hypothetical protein
MKHPLDWIPGKNRKPIFWIFLGLTVALLFLFQPLNQPLMTPAAPSGIISLQLAWTPDNARAMLASWDTDVQLYAAFGLGFDYLFMPAYALALSLGALLAAGRHPGWFSRLGAWVGYGALLAACFDALENLLQFQQLFHGRVDLALIVGLSATLKFSLIILGLLYGLSGWFWKKPK